MQANEFVKKFGWDVIKHDLSLYFKEENVGTIQILTQDADYIEVNGDDLKRLVESHEFVNRMIKDHNKSFPECQIDLIGLKSFAYGKFGKIFPKKLKQAIADVESCM